MGSALWKAFVFGVVVAAAIGPIALLIFGTAARRGFAAGGFAGLGAALADWLFSLAAFSIGALLLPPLAAHEATIRVACALLLVGVGLWMIWQQLPVRDPAAAMPRTPGSALLPTFTLTIVNPLTLVVFAGLVPQLPVAGSFTNAVGLALALFAGSLVVQLAIAAAGAGLGMALPDRRWQRAINAAAAAGILAFGVYGLASAI